MSIWHGAHKHRGLGFRLAMSVLTGTVAIFCTVILYDFHESKKALLASLEESARNKTMATVNRIEAVLTGVEKLPTYVGIRLEQSDDAISEVKPRLKDILRANPDIFGATMAFADGLASNHCEGNCVPYYYRGDGSDIKFKYLDDSVYPHTAEDWFLVPRILGRPVWSEPYFDEGGGDIVMATYSYPIYRREADGERTFAGVVAADVSLECLQRLVASITFGKTGYAFLLSQSGVFVTHPRQDLVMRESIFSLAEASGDKQLRAVGRAMIGGGSGFVRISNSTIGEKVWLFYAPIPSMGGSVGLVMPERELFADLVSETRNVAMMSGLGLLLLLLVTLAIARAIVRPIGMLAASTADIAKGNLDTPLPTVRSKDEIADLATSFESMRQALKTYIADLTETTAAKERLDSELKIAHSIQMSFLPKKFPPFPDRSEFSIHAFMEPAKAVGGDLYDFCLLGDTHLFFAIGDVSGKGVPAALLMAVTKTLIKGIAEQGTDPAEVLSRVNRELCMDNESMMFVTAICGTLDLKTGELLISNAGHNPPLIVGEGGLDGAGFFDLPPGVVLAVDEDAAYRTARHRLRPGATLLLYTDGVTEAMDAGGDMYSEERLIEAAAASRSSGPKELIEAVLEDVKAHTGGMEQSDDITLLALQYHGADKPGEENQ